MKIIMSSLLTSLNLFSRSLLMASIILLPHFFIPLTLAKASSFPPWIVSTGLIPRTVPRAAPAGVTLPPLSKYLSVSTAI